MAHTPSTPTVTPPASATDPRYSTSGILNNQIKEKNRQGLLSTYGGRTGKRFDINKFAENKISMRDPSAVPLLEQLAKYYADAGRKGSNLVTNGSTASAEAGKNIYNQSVDKVNNLLSEYGVKDSGLTKAGKTTRTGVEWNHTLYYNKKGAQVKGFTYGTENADEVRAKANKIGATGEIFNQVAESAKKKLNPTK